MLEPIIASSPSDVNDFPAWHWRGQRRDVVQMAPQVEAAGWIAQRRCGGKDLFPPPSGGFAQKLKIEYRIDEFTPVKIQ
jgi:hypothetical protein